MCIDERCLLLHAQLEQHVCRRRRRQSRRWRRPGRRVRLGPRPEPAVDVEQPRAPEEVLEDVQASPARRGRSTA